MKRPIRSKPQPVSSPSPPPPVSVSPSSDDRQYGAHVARKLKLNPYRIVEAFLGALEDANQHDFYRIVEAEWRWLTAPGTTRIVKKTYVPEKDKS